jgi:hypothetical protein
MEKIRRSEESNVVSIPVILLIFTGTMMIIGGLEVILIFGWYHQSMFGMGGMGGLMMFANMMHAGAGMWWSPVPIPNTYTFSLGASISFSSILIGIGAVYATGGYHTYKKPGRTRNWSIVILTASIIGLFDLGGLGISTGLGIIAGGIGLASSRK